MSFNPSTFADQIFFHSQQYEHFIGRYCYKVFIFRMVFPTDLHRTPGLSVVLTHTSSSILPMRQVGPSWKIVLLIVLLIYKSDNLLLLTNKSLPWQFNSLSILNLTERISQM